MSAPHGSIVVDGHSAKKPATFTHAFTVMSMCSGLAVLFVLLNDYSRQQSSSVNDKVLAPRSSVEVDSSSKSPIAAIRSSPAVQLMDSSDSGDPSTTCAGGPSQKETADVLKYRMRREPLQPWWKEDCGRLVELAEALNPKYPEDGNTRQGPSRNDNEIHEKSLVFLRLWKTGGSSVLNIIYRKGDAMNVTFVLPRADVFVPEELTSDYPVLSCDSDRQMNIFALPSTGFSKTEVEKVVQDHPRWVTLIRNPSDVYKSSVRQQKYIEQNVFGRNFTFDNDKVAKPEAHFQLLQRIAAIDFMGIEQNASKDHNEMMLDLGIPRVHITDQDAVSRHVEYLRKVFDLVMIAEKMDESLILLRHLMSWNLEDIIGFRHGDEIDKEEPWIPVATYKNLQYQNWPVRYLYREFNRVMHQKLANFGVNRMEAEIDALRCMRRVAFRLCQVTELPASEIKDDRFRPVFGNLRGLMPKYSMSPTEHAEADSEANWLSDWCAKMCTQDKQFLSYLRRKQGCSEAEPLRSVSARGHRI